MNKIYPQFDKFEKNKFYFVTLFRRQQDFKHHVLSTEILLDDIYQALKDHFKVMYPNDTSAEFNKSTSGQNKKHHKTGVINDPLDQTHNPASSDHYYVRHV